MKAKRKPEPYQWASSTGWLKMRDLRQYARWLFPQIARKWEAEGVQDFTLPQETEDKPPEIYRFPKTVDLCRTEHLIHFADYVFKALKPYSDRAPYQWPKRTGLTKVPDLKRLHSHLQKLLKEKRDKSNQ